MAKVSLKKSTVLKNYIPERHKNALRYLFDPYRQQKAGWYNGKSSIIIDYAYGGLQLVGPIQYNTGAPGTKDWVDSNSDGLADGIVKSDTMDASIVTGNGFTKNAQRFDYTDDSGVFYFLPTIDTTPGELYRFRFKYRSSANFLIGNGVSVVGPTNSGQAQWLDYTAEATYDGVIAFRYTLDVIASGSWMEIGEFSLHRLEGGSHGRAFGSLGDTGWGSDQAGIELDGINDYIDFDDAFNLEYNSFVLFGWFRNPDVSATGTYKEILRKYQDTANSINIRYQTGRYYFYSEVASDTISNYSNDVILTQDDHWYFAASTVDRDSTFSGIVMNYIDAVEDPPELTTYWHDQDVSHTNTAPWTIGTTTTDGHIGIVGIYMFDGENGAESTFPDDVPELIQDLYNNMWPLYSGQG